MGDEKLEILLKKLIKVHVLKFKYFIKDNVY